MKNVKKCKNTIDSSSYSRSNSSSSSRYSIFWYMKQESKSFI